MGVKLKDLVAPQTIGLDDLRDKILAVDTMNMLYQFLTTIRQRDGSLLLDSKGRVTSHLNGLFHRCTAFIEKGMRLVFVFDGKPPEIKLQETARRAELKREAGVKHAEAAERGDVDAMRKYAARTAVLSREMVEQSKELLGALGVPVIQAPSEGEAQAAYLTKKGDAFAVVSQDFDSLLFGSERLVRNLSIEGRRKKAGKLQYDIVRPEMIVLSDVLNTLGIDQKQLIVLGMLVGTDYNPGGIYGIGPKNALKLVKQEKDFEKLFEKVEWTKRFDADWRFIFDLFKDMPVTGNYELRWRAPNIERLRELLVEEYDFSAERVEQRLKKFVKEREEKKQIGLGEWM